MQSTPKKVFSDILESYQFFERHSTEAEKILAICRNLVQGWNSKKQIKSVLDFGCGSGKFMESLLLQGTLPYQSLNLNLAEPDPVYKGEALNRLQPYLNNPISFVGHDLTDVSAKYDLIIANHVLYYVDDLRKIITKLKGTLAPGGHLMITISDARNPLTHLLLRHFELRNLECPYYTFRCVDQKLRELGLSYIPMEARSELRFNNTIENRDKIISFILGSHRQLKHRSMVEEFFERYSEGTQIRIPLVDQIMIIKNL